MARRRTARHPKQEEIAAEDETQEAPEEQAAVEATEPASDNTPSKAEIVRQAVAAGMEKPQEGVDWIRERYGVEMAKPTWSSYRAQLKARERKGESPRSRKANGPLPQTLFDDLKALREMKDRYGEGFQRLVEAIG